MGRGKGEGPGRTPGHFPPPPFLLCPALFLFYRRRKNESRLVRQLLSSVKAESSNLEFREEYLEPSGHWYGVVARHELITYPSYLRWETSHLHHGGLFITALLPCPWYLKDFCSNAPLKTRALTHGALGRGGENIGT